MFAGNKMHQIIIIIIIFNYYYNIPNIFYY